MSFKTQGFPLIHTEQLPPFYETSSSSSPTFSSHEELEARLVDAITEEIASGDGDCFNVFDLGQVDTRFELWSTHLPEVFPYYAVKSCPDMRILEKMAKLNMGFDCASKKELDLVLGLGVEPSRILYANTCKQPSHIRHARARGVRRATFDSESELIKISSLWPDCELLLRIWTDDSHSSVKLSSKFGVPVGKETDHLLQVARGLGLEVVGVSFHVGSNCENSTPYAKAIKDARVVFDQGEKLGFTMLILDVGGGMPDSSRNQDFFEIAAAIKRQTKLVFNFKPQLVAEPGRFFSAPIMTTVCSVIGKKQRTLNQIQHFEYGINQGAFGVFFEGMIVPRRYQPILLQSKSQYFDPQYPTKLWGPTCASQDTLQCPDLHLPELEVDDWLCFRNMGAYSVGFGFDFNGFGSGDRVYVDSSYCK